MGLSPLLYESESSRIHLLEWRDSLLDWERKFSNDNSQITSAILLKFLKSEFLPKPNSPAMQVLSRCRESFKESIYQTIAKCDEYVWRFVTYDSGGNPGLSDDWLKFHRETVAIKISEVIHILNSVVDTKLLPPDNPQADEEPNKKPSYNARMIDTLQSKPESLEWSTQNWADHLGCVKSTVHDQPAWKEIMRQREANKIARLMREQKN